MSRTIDDYDSMARREIIKAKQEKATSYVLVVPRRCPALTDTTRRVQKFKSDYAEFRKELERIKEEVSEKRNFYTPLLSTNKYTHSTQRHSAQSSSPRAPALFSHQTRADASPHLTQPHPPLHHT
jgi:Golgi SNAP receptor complex protein 2